MQPLEPTAAAGQPATHPALRDLMRSLALVAACVALAHLLAAA